MEASPESTILEVPRARFDIEAVLKHVFSIHEVGSYLVSKDPMPSKVISPESLDNALNIDSLVLPDRKIAATLLRRADFPQHPETDSSEERKFQDAQEIAAAQTEQLFYIPLSSTEDYCLLSVCDARTPLAFLVKPSEAVKGLRRVALLKLDKLGLMNAHVILTHFWLANGRSSMTLLIYDVEQEFYSEKWFVSFKEYPSCRFPRHSDILETMVAIEQFICSYCTLRGLPDCTCPKEMVRRLKAPLPPQDRRDPLSLHRWSCMFFESGVQKYIIQLTNIPTKFQYAGVSYHKGVSTMRGQYGFAKGWQTYLQELKPLFDRQMLIKKNSSFLNAAEQQGPRMLLLGRCREDSVPLPSSGIVIRSDPKSKKRLRTRLSSDKDCSKRTNPSAPSRNRAITRSINDDDEDDIEVVDSATEDEEHKAITKAYFDKVDSMPWPADYRSTCKLCEYSSFARKHDLKRHIQSKHMEQRAFTCTICSLHFTRRSHLSIHNKARHQHVQFRCEICDATFSYKAALRRHAKSRHGDLSAITV